MSYRANWRSWALLLGIAASFGAAAQSPDGKNFEGRYRYHGELSIDFAVSPRDGVMYAILNEARYPLKRLGEGIYADRQGSRVIFSGGNRPGYLLEESTGTNFFNRLAAVSFPSTMWSPRGNGPGSVTYQYSPPAQMEDGLTVGGIHQGKLDLRKIEQMIQAIADEKHPNLHSILVVHEGKLVLEEYFYQYDRTMPHQLRSATKSIVSALVGIAIDKKLIRSKSEKVVSFFPEYRLQNPSPHKDQITIEDLLSNRSGLECDDTDQNSAGNEIKMGRTEDWVKFILDLPSDRAPGDLGRYCSGGVIVLGRIVEKASGLRLAEFARTHFFGPLGIKDFTWRFNPDRSSSEDFCQVHLRPRDMMKIGLLYLNGGKWNGQQLISPEWIEASLAKHSVVNQTDYGYLWWRQWLNVDGKRIEGVTAKGNGGQRIYLWPSLQAAAVVTAGSYNERSHADELLVKYVLPALAGTSKDE